MEIEEDMRAAQCFFPVKVSLSGAKTSNLPGKIRRKRDITQNENIKINEFVKIPKQHRKHERQVNKQQNIPIKSKQRHKNMFSLCCCHALFSENFKTALSELPAASCNCLLWCQGRRHLWHDSSSPRRTTPRFAVYRFDKLHYSSGTIPSRPPTVAQRSNRIWETPRCFPSRRQKISLCVERPLRRREVKLIKTPCSNGFSYYQKEE